MNTLFRSCFAVSLLMNLHPAHADAPASDDMPAKSKTIFYSASAIPLQRMADDLSRQTGATIRIGSGDRDWRVKERKVHISFHELPLEAALLETARTLHYHLHVTADAGGKPIYRIWQNTRDRDYEDAMLAAQREEAERQRMARGETALQAAQDALSLTPEDAKKLRDKDPWLAYLGGSEGGRAYAQVLSGLPPDARELFMRGRKVTLEAGDLSPEAQAAFSHIIPDSLKDRIIGSMGPQGDLFRKLKPARIVFQPLTEGMGTENEAALGGAGMAVVLGETDDSSPEYEAMLKNSPFAALGKGVPMASLPVVQNGSPLSKIQGDFLLGIEEGKDPATLMRETDQRMHEAASSSANSSAPAQAPPTDPRLLQVVEPFELKKGGEWSAELVRQLGRKTSLSFVWDVYESETARPLLPARKAPLYKILGALRSAGWMWEFETGVVRIHPNDWAVQRSYVVPESVLARYRKLLSEPRVLNLSDYAALADALTDGQIDHRLLKDETLQRLAPGLTGLGSGLRAMLRLYARLTPAQKARLNGAPGLPFDALNEAQWQLLAPVVEEETGGLDPSSGQLSLKMEGPEPSDETPKPVAAAPSSDADQVAVFTVNLPPEGPGNRAQTFVRRVRIPGKKSLQTPEGPSNSH
jgi:hypothetical protein